MQYLLHDVSSANTFFAFIGKCESPACMPSSMRMGLQTCRPGQKIWTAQNAREGLNTLELKHAIAGATGAFLKGGRRLVLQGTLLLARLVLKGLLGSFFPSDFPFLCLNQKKYIYNIYKQTHYVSF
jgi:hypothetical protein